MSHDNIAICGHEDVAGPDIAHFLASPVESVADIGEAVEQVPELTLVKVLILFGLAVEDFAQEHEGRVLVLDLA